MPQSTITGVITYRQRVALPHNAAIAITLQDLSQLDAAAIVASTNFCSGGRQVPIPFVLSYNPSKINPQHTYAVQVRITVNEQLRFLNMTAYPVITRSYPTTVEIVVNAVS